MLIQIFDTVTSSSPVTLAALDNMRVTLPLLLLSVPTVLVLMGIASENPTVNSKKRERRSAGKRVGSSRSM